MKTLVYALATALALSSSPAISQNNTSRVGSSSVQPTAVALQRSYGKLPLSFEANRGQADDRVRFVSRGKGYALFLTNREMVLALSKPTSADLSNQTKTTPRLTTKPNPAFDDTLHQLETDVIRMQLVGASSGLKVAGQEKLPGTANYFIGNDVKKWHTDIPTYAKVKYAGVYPGVDLVYYGNHRQLEYDLVVAAGADPARVKLHFACAKMLKLDADGNLEIIGRHGEVVFHKPEVYQLKKGLVNGSASEREYVQGTFKLLPGNTINFRLGHYDTNRALVIDPTLVYSSYLGGTDAATSSGKGIAVDSLGNIYLAGTTGSSKFPINPPSTDPGSSIPAGTPNYPTGSYTPVGFITKFDSTGTTLIYSTYIGGSGSIRTTPVKTYAGDSISAIAVDALGNAYVCGTANSGNLPMVNAIQAVNKAYPSGSNAFVAKLNPAGSQLVYSTFLGGNANSVPGAGDGASSLALDPAGSVYIAGSAFSTGSADGFLVTQGAYQETNNAAANQQSNAWIARIDFPRDTPVLGYSTFLGGSGNTQDSGVPFPFDAATGIAIDSSRNAYVVGSTVSSDFPTTEGAFQRLNKASVNNLTTGFVAELNPDGTGLIYSTLLGGSGTAALDGDSVSGVAVDSMNDAIVTGTTGSSDFPTVNAFQPKNNGLSTSTPVTNAFVSKLNPTGTQLIYSSYLGGTGNPNPLALGDSGLAIAVDSLGDAYLGGVSYSKDFPITEANAYQVQNKGYPQNAPNGFLTEISSKGTLIYSTYFGGSGFSGPTELGLPGQGDSVNGVAIDTSGTVYLVGSTSSGDFPITSSAFQSKNYAANVLLSGSAFFSKLTSPTSLQFIPVTPCRVVDTRNANGPLGGPELGAGTSREFDLPQGNCRIPANALAYSLNLTVVPNSSLNYATLWPSGQAQPYISTLNSDGRVKANAAIVLAGINGGVSVFATNPTQVILDINGYFVPAGTSGALAFYPVTPCRIADTRAPLGPLGGPYMAGRSSRSFPIPLSGCGLPSTAQAYSLNVTAVPHNTLNYLTTWPTGQGQPYVSTLNSLTGTVTANAAIVPAGTSGAVSVFVYNDADVILDVNGYFATPGTGGLSLYPVNPCRVIDTRPAVVDGTTVIPVKASNCEPPSGAEAYVLNATVIPQDTLNYLTLWPDGGVQPYVSTLNAEDGAITSNMAIVPTTNGLVDAFANGTANLILDISSYFAP